MITSNSRRHAKWAWAAAATVLCGVSFAQSLTTSPAENKSAEAYAEREKIDPVKANGEIFVDWPKPDVALVFSGEQDGYLEPCGCAGLENQKGGLKRRFTLLKELRGKGWPVVAMDVGGQEKRSGVQPELKIDFSLRALAKLGYEAVGFGPNDLRMDLLPIVINLDEPSKLLVSANVGIADFDESMTRRYKIVEAGGMKIGMTSILGKQEMAGLQNSNDLTLVDPVEALEQVMPKLREAQCDQLVLLAHAEPAEAQELARRFRDFNWVMIAHGAEEPPKEPVKIEGTDAYMIEAGHKGMYVAVVGLYKNGETPFRYQRVPLDSRFCRCAGDLPNARRVPAPIGNVGSGGTGAQAGDASQRPRICRQQGLRRLPLVGHGSVREHAPLPCHRNDREPCRSAAALRPRVHKLPRDRLGTAKVLSV